MLTLYVRRSTTGVGSMTMCSSCTCYLEVEELPRTLSARREKLASVPRVLSYMGKLELWVVEFERRKDHEVGYKGDALMLKKKKYITFEGNCMVWISQSFRTFRSSMMVYLGRLRDDCSKKRKVKGAGMEDLHMVRSRWNWRRMMSFKRLVKQHRAEEVFEGFSRKKATCL